jgi:tRNA threonylcarbamoyladenosine biosynthesis protein TsaE
VDTSISDKLRAGVRTSSADETRALAAAWAAGLPADATVALHGDLGAGKTTWVQGMAIGLGISEPVTSPTFTIYTLHQGMGRMLAHLDAYRLASADEAEGLLLEEYLVSPWCLAIEWPEKVPGWVPAEAWHLDMDIESDGRHSIRLR